MTKPKTEEERIDEFALHLYHAASHTRWKDYPTEKAAMKGGLGVLFHARHTVEEMEEIFKNIVRRVLQSQRLRLIRKPRKRQEGTIEEIPGKEVIE